MSSFQKRCWRYTDLDGQDSKGLPVVAALVVLELNPRTAIDAAVEAEDSMDAATRRDLERATEQVETNGESQDDAAEQRLIADAEGVAAVEGPAQKGGGDDRAKLKIKRDENEAVAGY